MPSPLLQVTERGLYCSAGDFFIDPWGPVRRAIITHAHADHARPGCERYLTSQPGVALLRLRVGDGTAIRGQPYGKPLRVGEAEVTLYPAGHLLGSAQIRVAVRGEVWVVTGDYKLERDATCEPFEVVPCDTLITESTFGLPIYRWQPQAHVFDEINAWWRANQAAGRTSLLFGYSLGKAQRLLAGVDPSIGPILVHGAVQRFNHAYQAAGISLPPTLYADGAAARQHRGQALVVAPPAASNSPGWLRKFGPVSLAFASGWMQIRGARRRRAIDRGFVLSDHADWPGLLATIQASGAEHIGVTHGYTTTMVRYLREQGYHAEVIPTRFEGEAGADPADAADIAEQPAETGNLDPTPQPQEVPFE